MTFDPKKVGWTVWTGGRAIQAIFDEAKNQVFVLGLWQPMADQPEPVKTGEDHSG